MNHRQKQEDAHDRHRERESQKLVKFLGVFILTAILVRTILRLFGK